MCSCICTPPLHVTALCLCMCVCWHIVLCCRITRCLPACLPPTRPPPCLPAAHLPACHPACLQVNYRTHSGILGVASAVVDVLKAFWPDSIDNLAREEAFFHVSLACPGQGLHALLLFDALPASSGQGKARGEER